MIKTTIIFHTLIVLLFICSCSDSGTLTEPTDGPEVITLYSGIGSITTSGTRGAGIIQTPLSQKLPVSFIRVDKPQNGNYPADYTNVPALAAHMIPTSNLIAFTNNQLYPANGSSVKFVGWYPATGVWNASTRSVTFGELDGTTDILASPGVEGSRTNEFTANQNQITFNHMLTQVRVFAHLESVDYQSVWGDLTAISISGKKQTCTLTLPATDATAGTKPTATFGTPVGDLSLQKPDNTGAVSTQTLSAAIPDTDTDAPIGYAMFAPHSGEYDKLKLKVTTAKAGTLTVEIPYKTGAEFAAGKSYDVVLTLLAFDIDARAGITAWESGGESIKENL